MTNPINRQQLAIEEIAGEQRAIAFTIKHVLKSPEISVRLRGHLLACIKSANLSMSLIETFPPADDAPDMTAVGAATEAPGGVA